MSAVAPWLVYCRRAFCGMVAAYVITSLSVGGTQHAKPLYVFLAGCWCACLWFGQGKTHRLVTGRASLAIRGAEIVVFNLALTLVLAEISLRMLAARTGDSLIVSNALEGYRLEPGREYGHGIHANRLGYPGPDFQREKRPGKVRIAALGDSFAVGLAVSYDENYLTLLEDLLPGTEVYNFGVAGTGPREYALILKKDVWTYQPDLVLVSIFVGNDITESLATPRALDPRQHAVYLLLTRAFRLSREMWLRAESEVAPAAPSTTATLSVAAFREVEARRLEVCLKTPPPGLEKKWTRTFGHLDGLISDCRSRHIPLAFVLIPDEFQVNPQVCAEALQTRGLESSALDLTLPQRRLQRFFAQRQVPCLDLLPSVTCRAPTYALRDTHWNALGNKLAAEKMAVWLKMIPRSPLR